ncbi:unnamed protein product [Lathyrus sativus]|nr:unnamed protein product [Lathyrus sativus]
MSPQTSPTLFFLILLSFNTLTSSSSSSSQNEDTFDILSPTDCMSLGLNMKEKLSHFRFYWHDIMSGKNPTSTMLVPPTLNSTTFFGSVHMIDSPMTLGPELSSKLVGKSQGFYASASQEELALFMSLNFVFEGKYNGSSITILGRNPVFDKVREMAVVGGTGVFRFARGYAQLSTHSFDPETFNAVVEYSVYVLHY